MSEPTNPVEPGKFVDNTSIPSKPILSDNMKHTNDIYKEMLTLERTKGAIYLNLWAILVTTLSGLLGFYLYDQAKNFGILLMIPLLLGVWAAFTGFNLLYLEALREYIKQIEKKIKIEMRLKGNSVLWFKDIFTNAISKNASIYLSLVVIIFFVIILSFIYDQILKFKTDISLIIAPDKYFFIIALLYLFLIVGFIVTKYFIRRKINKKFNDIDINEA